jgi:hypothetical protein
MGKSQGISSNKLVRPGQKHGQSARAQNPKGVAQYGTHRGNHAMNDPKVLHGDVEKVPMGRMGGVGSQPLGNEVARNVGKGGCGTGRTLYGKGGTQGCH